MFTPIVGVQPTPTVETAKGKPNIIFILTDDLDASAIQYMPKLKSLITDQGETFTNYFVAESLCCPSRATTLRGQYPHNTEIVGNSMPTGGFRKFFQLGEEQSTIAVWLQGAGYRTMLAGKYLNGYPLKKDPTYIPPGWNEWYSPMKGNSYSEYNYTLNENGQQVAYGNQPKDYGTDVYVGKTVDFIQRSAKEGKPFFVYLASYAPHAPYTPAPRHANLFANLEAPRTPNYNEADVSDKPAYISERPSLTQAEQDTIDKDYRKRVQALQAVDEGIEAIVNTLKANGQFENTYIFFTSDNGYHLGNHRQLMGKVAPYDEEMRVTMIVRGPGVPAGVTLGHLTGNVDLAPTWAELAGAKAADFCDGRSLVPLMRTNPPALNQWRQAFSFEYGIDQIDTAGGTETPATETDPGLLEPQDQDESDTAALSPEKQAKINVPPFRGIRLQNLSFVEYKTGEIELYDIKADPFELENLAKQADPKLLKQLSARLVALATCKAATCRTAEDEPFDLPASLTHTSIQDSNRFGVFTSQNVAAK
jgi:N-acetylglucosamine-6-sulfatase